MLDPELRRALAERIRYYNELGIYDFYRRETPPILSASPESQDLGPEEMTPRARAGVDVSLGKERAFEVGSPKPETGIADPAKALRLIREDLGDCTRCPLHKQGRKQIVFGVGNPQADLMFIGEAPGADEDQQGEPFVGRAGQLLNNMIKAMGLRREDVYIANIIKCRPPGNRTPEREECETCSPFLMRQIAVIQAEGHCGVRRSGSEDLAGDQCAHVRAARSLVRLPWNEAGCYLSSGVLVARSATEERSLEGSADGDERFGTCRARKKHRVRYRVAARPRACC